MISTVVFASGRAWVRSAFPVSSAIVRASSSIRGSSASATRARSCPRSRGIMRDQAGNASAAAFTARATSSTRPRGISATRPAVRWILDLKHLARRALDPFPADQHERFLERRLVTARLSESRHDRLVAAYRGLGAAKRNATPPHGRIKSRRKSTLAMSGTRGRHS